MKENIWLFSTQTDSIVAAAQADPPVRGRKLETTGHDDFTLKILFFSFPEKNKDIMKQMQNINQRTRL